MAKQKVKVQVPDSLDEITLGQYQDYLKATEGLDEESDSDKISELALEHFCGIKIDDALQLPYSEINKVLGILSKAFDKDHQLIKFFKLDGVEMGFIPKLDDMTLGEYVDLDGTINSWEDMHRAMAVLFRPVNKKIGPRYTIAEYEANEEIPEIMRHMPLNAVFGALVFFYSLGKELSIATLNYIEKMMETEESSSPLKIRLEKSGVGINQFMHSLRVISQDLMKLPNFRSINV